MINETSRPANQTIPGPNVTAIAELAPIALIIVIVNMLVFVVFLKTKKLRTPANYVLFSLAINDFLTGALNIPLFIIVVFTPVITTPPVRFHLGFLVAVVHTLTAILSVYHIAIATLEKYLSIIWPITHRLVKKATVTKVLILVWLLSIVIGFIPFTWVNKIHDTVLFTKYTMAYVIFCFVVVFFLPYSFMLFAFFKIFRAISRGAGQSGNNGSRKSHLKKLARERKCIILFVTMATLFAICWLPWFSLMLLYAIKFEPKASLLVPSHVFTLVRYTTSVINPLLYSLLRPDFYAALKKVMKRTGLSITAICASCQQRRQNNHASRANHVCSSASEQLQALSNEREELTGNDDVTYTVQTSTC